jgi:ethanolamine transporter EutH
MFLGSCSWDQVLIYQFFDPVMLLSSIKRPIIVYTLVIPAAAGIQNYLNWTPVAAGVTTVVSTLPNVVTIVGLLIIARHITTS